MREAVDMNSDLLLETRTVTPADLAVRPHAQPASLDELLPLLASPDSGRPLAVAASSALTDGEHEYPRRGEALLLLPARLHAYFTDRLVVPPSAADDAFMQYFLLASIKQSGEINAAPDNVHYQRHLFRLQEFCKNASGLVLDVGCDDAELGASLLPPAARYAGIDPFCMRTAPFRLIGVGEYLPFQDGTVDGVLFNTSLDHILDWRRALEEAHRVLKPGGMLYLCTIIWTARADLMTDTVHFHHFRDYEILGALDRFTIEATRRYDYKGDNHRHGLYLSARKRGA